MRKQDIKVGEFYISKKTTIFIREVVAELPDGRLMYRSFERENGNLFEPSKPIQRVSLANWASEVAPRQEVIRLKREGIEEQEIEIIRARMLEALQEAPGADILRALIRL